MQPVHYDCCTTLNISDHRPVYGIFEATIKPVKDRLVVFGRMKLPVVLNNQTIFLSSWFKVSTVYSTIKTSRIVLTNQVGRHFTRKIVDACCNVFLIGFLLLECILSEMFILKVNWNIYTACFASNFSAGAIL